MTCARIPVTWNGPRRRRAPLLTPRGWAACALALAYLAALYFIARVSG